MLKIQQIIAGEFTETKSAAGPLLQHSEDRRKSMPACAQLDLCILYNPGSAAREYHYLYEAVLTSISTIKRILHMQAWNPRIL